MRTTVFCLFLILLVLPSTALTKESIIVAGAGPSAAIVDLFFKNFSNQPEAADYTFVVPAESIKHAGGIRHSLKNLFGRTGRPLNDTEKRYQRDEIFLAVMPISIATGSNVKISSLSITDLQAIFQKRITNWKRLGGPDQKIITVGREPTEALFSELKRFYMFFRKAHFDVILNKDHEVVDFLESEKGQYAISFGAKANLSHLNQVHISDELKTGVRLGLVYDKKNQDHPLVQAVKNYAQSDEWASLVQKYGAYPVTSGHRK
jgi:hypothetical protein